MRSSSVLAGVALALATACGGQTTHSGSGGSVASGGTTSTGGSSASGGGGAVSSGGTGGVEPCAPGGKCAVEGSACKPPGCCTCEMVCVAGQWAPTPCPMCPAPSCPAVVPPKDGEPCNECEEPVDEPCAYGQCPSEVVIATCDGKAWHTSVAPCPPPTACPCSAGELCVHPGGLGDQPYCAANTCGPSQPVSCSCAGSLCTYGFCSGAGPSDVFCECPNC